MLKKFTKRIISFMAAAVMAVTNTVPIAPISAFSEEAEETGLTMQTIEVSPDEKDGETVITLEGMMPEGAAAEAVDVSGERDCIAAYDITITAGEEEFQPGEENPIKVEIADPAITDSKGIQLWHIADDGEREQILDFTLEEGKISFYAEGFSVYEIVEMGLPEDIDTGWKIVNSLNTVASIGGNGVYISNQEGKYYLTGGFVDNVTDDRSGLAAMTVDIVPASPPSEACLFYFESVEGSDNQFYIYKIEKDEENNDTYQYVKMTKITSNNSSTMRGGLKFVEKNSDGTHDGTLFTLEYNNNAFFCSYVLYEGQTAHYWNRNTKTTGKGAIAAYQSKSDGNIYKLQLHYFKEFSDDPFDLDYDDNKKEYGLMHNTGDEVGYALMANKNFNAQLSEMILKEKKLYVFEDSDITMWRFENVDEDNYKLYATIDGVTQYLKLQSDEKSFAVTEDSSSAQIFRIEPTNSNTVKISCTVGDDKKYLKFTPGTPATETTPEVKAKYDMSGTSATDATEMNFVELAADSGDTKTYTANCISVSDGAHARTGQKVIVYTRLWKEKTKKYDTYAIDGDGTLQRVYAYGDKIMWLDDKDVTLFWDFTVYYLSGTQENGYYELRNTSTNKYLAPQLNGAILSDDTIGIRLPGRKYEKVGDKLNEGEYYSAVTAWDNSYYDYAALYGEYDSNGTPELKVGTLGEAGTFYFAVLGDEVYHDEKDRLHEVVTLDNDKYGIKMKMIDFPSRKYASDIMGNDTYDQWVGVPNLLSTNLDGDYPNTTKTNKSLSELFAGGQEVNHLFIKSIYDSSGYFEFDSSQNFATLNGQNGGNFTVYRELGTNDIKTTPSMKHGQFLPYNTIVPLKYTTNANEYDSLQNELPGDDDSRGRDPRKGEKLHNVQHDSESTNYYFGMELEAKFVQTPSGLDAWGHDIIFEFTGDDDFWLYVDGELVIDLGGIHSALDGKVNFRTGDVIINTTDGEKHKIETNLRDLFYNNYLKRNRTEAEAEQYLLEEYCKNSSGEIRNITLAEFQTLYPYEYNAYVSALSETEAKAYINNHILCGRNITLGEYIDSHKSDYEAYMNAGHTDAEAYAYFTGLIQNYPMTADEYIAVYSADYTDMITEHTNAEEHFCSRQITFDEFIKYQQSIGNNTDYQSELDNYIATKHTKEEAKAYVNSIFENNENVFKDYTEHSMKIFYMERGAGASNLHMRFNLSAVTPGNVLFSKQLSNIPENAGLDLNDVQYPFQIMWKYTDSSEENWKYLGDKDAGGNITVSYQNSTQTVQYAPTYTPASLVGKTDDDGHSFEYKNVFFITPGKYLEIKFPDNAMYYQIKECAVDSSIYKKVTATGPDGSNIALDESKVLGSIKDLLAAQTQVSEQPTIAFNNVLNDDQVKKLHITKVLYNENGKGAGNILKYAPGQEETDVDNTTFSFRLYLSNGTSDALQPANLHKYYVADADNKICRWDVGLQRFVRYKNSSNSEIDASGITGEDQKNVTFYTSPYGSVTNIPAGYSIIVPGLISGTLFRVEERDYEIPVGYALLDFERVTDITNGSNTDGSYELLEQGDNSRGKIKATTDAYMRVNNLRGIGLKADKIWTDEDFTTGHAPVYTAVYCEKSGEPSAYVDNTLRKIEYPDTSVKYFFKKLPDGVTINDYKIYEVTVENEQDENMITKLAQSSTVTLGVTDMDGTSDNADYTVYYDPGTPKKSSPSVPGTGENVREDKIKNVRSGGVEILLNEWSTTADFEDDERLEGGRFRLKSVDPFTGISSEVGTYTTGKDGVVTVIYNFTKDENYDSTNKEILYRLEEIDPPDGYIGLTKPVSFKIKQDDQGKFELFSWSAPDDTDNDNDLKDGKNWTEYETTTGNLVARINIYNNNPPSPAQEFYFRIEKNIFVDKNIHDSDTEQKFVFRVERLDENDQTTETFFVTMNCGTELNDFPYALAADSKYSFDSAKNEVTVSYGNGKSYVFPAAIFNGQQTVKVRNAGKYRVSEVSKWSSTDYDFWKGSNIYTDNSGGSRTAVETGTDEPYIIFVIGDADTEKSTCSAVSFTNTESEYAYLSAQAYAENTIKRSNS